MSFDCNDGRIHFITFQTRRVNSALEYMLKRNIFEKDEVILATGGGAHKYSEAFTKKLGVNFIRGDELTCLLKGLNFLLEHIPDECYYFSRPDVRSDETTEPYDMQVLLLWRWWWRWLPSLEQFPRRAFAMREFRNATVFS